jgi:hypothetical protein
MTGEMKHSFQEEIRDDLDSTMPKNAFDLMYIIKPLRGLERLDSADESLIQQDDHTWADEAKSRWQKDRQVLEHFYEAMDNKPECYEMEKKAMDEQYQTKIKLDIVNGGLFYIS